MKNIKLNIEGPFKLTEFIEIPASEKFGIYIFTLKIKDRFVIEYVGITARKFKTRFIEHIKEILSGGYVLYDIEKIESNNMDFFVWNGRFGKNREKMSDFFKNYEYFSKIIKKQIEAFNIFIIPLDEEKRVLEMIEGELYKILRKNGNEVTKKCLSGINSTPRRAEEETFSVELSNNIFSREIPDKFQIT